MQINNVCCFHYILLTCMKKKMSISLHPLFLFVYTSCFCFCRRKVCKLARSCGKFQSSENFWGIYEKLWECCFQIDEMMHLDELLHLDVVHPQQIALNIVAVCLCLCVRVCVCVCVSVSVSVSVCIMTLLNTSHELV